MTLLRNLAGELVKMESEPVNISCPCCNNKKLRLRMSPIFQFGCIGDTHEHLYCGKCHKYICEICNPEINEIFLK